MNEQMRKNLGAMEIWFLRRMIRIPWVAKLADKTVLKRLRKVEHYTHYQKETHIILCLHNYKRDIGEHDDD